jgi:hypothetical protein
VKWVGNHHHPEKTKRPSATADGLLHARGTFPHIQPYPSHRDNPGPQILVIGVAEAGARLDASLRNSGIAIEPRPRRPSAPLYFALTYCISWAGALALVAPHLLHGEPIPKFTGLMMFPIMLLGPALASIVLTARAEGWHGIRALARRMNPLRIPPRWTPVLLIPPVLVLAVLGSFALLVSNQFAPNHFWVGMAFGVVAGIVEEIGWMG